jgi:hypothetical protein
VEAKIGEGLYVQALKISIMGIIKKVGRKKKIKQH